MTPAFPDYFDLNQFLTQASSLTITDSQAQSGLHTSIA
jgi:hypothetical protein